MKKKKIDECYDRGSTFRLIDLLNDGALQPRRQVGLFLQY